MTQGQPGARVTVEWPYDPAYLAVGRLVLGGVGARADLPYDRVEELGLALDALVRCPAAAGSLVLEIEAAAEGLTTTVGRFERDPLADPGVARVVRALTDDARSDRFDDGFVVELTVQGGAPTGA